jgi:hypothetical protein
MALRGFIPELGQLESMAASSGGFDRSTQRLLIQFAIRRRTHGDEVNDRFDSQWTDRASKTSVN